MKIVSALAIKPEDFIPFSFRRARSWEKRDGQLTIVKLENGTLEIVQGYAKAYKASGGGSVDLNECLATDLKARDLKKDSHAANCYCS